MSQFDDSAAPVLELRVALTAAEYGRLLRFYRDALGLAAAANWDDPQAGSHATLFRLGSGALELFDEAHAAAVDAIEVGARVTGPIRFALQVPDLDAALARLAAHGTMPLAPPVVTPWGDRNVRVQAPDGLQITLYEVPPA